MQPETRYARSGDLHIAYQVFGNGPTDLVIVPGFASHLELIWEHPIFVRSMERFATFCRVIVFDKRGTGLSDPVGEVPTLEERMDDVRAVMDAANSSRAALLGISEGGPMCLLFAAAHPERVSALLLYGSMARTVEDEDYPWAAPAEAFRESARLFIAPYWGTGADIEIFSPSIAEDPAAREFTARWERNAASPSMIGKIFEMFLDIDVRDVLPVIRVPTLVLHRKGDRVVNHRAGRWMADQIAGSKFVELEGIDHLPWTGDADSIVDEIEEFLTGVKTERVPDRALLTVMFTDIVNSTELAARIGDRRWRELLDSYHALTDRHVERFRGKRVKVTGDGFLATFDGPARAIECSRVIIQEVRKLGLEVRVGLHAGECEIMNEDIGGIAVHIGSRVASTALPGEILVSSTVKDLVAGSTTRFMDRGLHPLKGLPGTWHLFSVLDPQS